MAKFLEPRKLRTEVKSLFEEAEDFLLIVSPFIKLDYELKQILQAKKNESELQIVLLFGKNDNNLGKSLSSGDLSFFQQFDNIEIYYHPDLHAKYYANDFTSIITSLNLHTYSLANNIEVGVKFERKRGLFGNDDNREDDKSFNYFMDLIPTTEQIFVKSTSTKSSFFGLFKSKQKSRVEVDNTNQIHHNDHSFKPRQNAPPKGYCIRTGVQIPFNLDKPFSRSAYDSWAQFGNYDYPEKFCHFSGEKSNGQTSCGKPVLYHHYKKAVELQNRIFG